MQSVFSKSISCQQDREDGGATLLDDDDSSDSDVENEAQLKVQPTRTAVWKDEDDDLEEELVPGTAAMSYCVFSALMSSCTMLHTSCNYISCSHVTLMSITWICESNIACMGSY